MTRIELKELQNKLEYDDVLEERRRKMPEQEQLITKYRPISFEEVIGNTQVVESLSKAVKSDSKPHAYLLMGPSGIGKTTLAQIIARELDAAITPVRAAVNSSVEDTRALADLAVFKPITTQKNSIYIIDEAHNLSQKGFEPLLDLTENPPSFLYVALCTTAPEKIPQTLKTRCFPVNLKPLKPNEIDSLITAVADIEGWVVNNDVMNSIIMAAEGSARMALMMLQAGHNCQSRDELAQIINKVVSEQSPAIALCRYLMTGKREWKAVSSYFSKIDDYEQALNDMSTYIASAISRSEDQQAHEFWLMLQKFTRDPSWNKQVQFYSAIGSIMWGTIPF